MATEEKDEHVNLTKHAAVQKPFLPAANSPVDALLRSTKGAVTASAERQSLLKAIESVKNLEGILLKDKINIILVLLGEKRHISFFMFADLDKGKNRGNILNILKDIGLQFKVVRRSPSNKERTDGLYDELVHIGLNVDDVDAFIAAQDEKTQSDIEICGMLSGFPKTAIDAYIKNIHGAPVRIFSISDLPEAIQREFGPFCEFVFSENWRAELETPKRWSDLIKEYAPELHAEFLANREIGQKPQIIKFE